MPEFVPFRLHITGDLADRHQFEGYDGYMALAGFAWMLSLVANYTETGEIRYRGEFPGRHAVIALPPGDGSVVADFKVLLSENARRALGLPMGTEIGAPFLYDLVRRVIGRNLGQDQPVTDAVARYVVERRAGDIEALVARTEAPIRQAHGLIGRSASQVEILGGHNIINTFDEQTKDYVKLNVEDPNNIVSTFSVSAFNANIGSGAVFDPGIGRNVPISMSKEVLSRVRSIYTWGLDQYANRTGGKVRMNYTRILAMDETPKRYVVVDAAKVENPG